MKKVFIGPDSLKYRVSRKIFYIFVGLLLVLIFVLIFIGHTSFGMADHGAEYAIIWLAVSILLVATIAIVVYFRILRPFMQLISKLLKLYVNVQASSGKSVQRDHVSPDEMLDAVMEYQQSMANRELTLKYLRAEAELIALQSQINPHFLFNTLESIRGFAQKKGVSEIADITEAISSLFRNSIQKVDMLIPLSAELENVRNYMLIQEFRFPGKFTMEVNIHADGDDLLLYKLPNLTLQPIVENAIFHGLELIPSDGKILLDIYATEKRLIIHITDNGCGIPKERLTELNTRLRAGDAVSARNTNWRASGMGIGLVNIHQRIQLQLGAQYGLTVASTLNIGTEVEVTLPLLSEHTV